MIWENEIEIVESMLYWQKRALEAEKEREELLDELEFYITAAADYKTELIRLEEIIEDSFSDYTKKILKEERRRGMIEVDGNR